MWLLIERSIPSTRWWGTATLAIASSGGLVHGLTTSPGSSPRDLQLSQLWLQARIVVKHWQRGDETPATTQARTQASWRRALQARWGCSWAARRCIPVEWRCARCLAVVGDLRWQMFGVRLS